tara:strand:+ start:84 stop:380 length:297 start_codon:yes stop_codon:yes gene_type:complete
MKLDYSTLKELSMIYGSDDFKIEAKYDKFDGEEYIMLRFGYWNEVKLKYLEALFNPLGYKVEVNEWEDDDCGWKHSYHIKESNNPLELIPGFMGTEKG